MGLAVSTTRRVPLTLACLLAAATLSLSPGCKDPQSASTTRSADAPAAGGPPAQGPSREVPVRLAPVERTPLSRTIDIVGTLVADHDAILSAKVPGRVISLTADVGDRVPANGILARLDDQDYLIALRQREFALGQVLAELGLERLPDDTFDPSGVPSVVRARAEAENAAERLERVRRLFEVPSPLIAEQEYRDRLTELEVARRNLDLAELAARALVAAARTREAERAAAAQRLADTVIRVPAAITPEPQALASTADSPAPTASTPLEFAVAERFVSVGEYVREGDRLFRIVADQVMRLRSAVPEHFITQVAVGQTVLLTVEGHPHPFTGVLRRISPAIDTATRTLQVEADFLNPRRFLKAGAFARARIVVGQRTDVATVPAAAVITFAGIDRVFSVDDGKAVEHIVRIVERHADTVAIEGLPPTVRQVVVEGVGRLARGTAVTLQ